MVTKKLFWVVFWIIFIVVFLIVAFFVSPFVYKAITGNYPSGFPLKGEVKVKADSEFNKQEDEIPSSQKESPVKIKWSKLESPPGGGYWTMTIANSDSDAIFIGTRDFNILKSSDGGKTWKLLGEKLFGAHIFSDVAVHPEDEDYILVSNGYVHYSDDGGEKWNMVPAEQIGSGESEGVTALTFDPQIGNKVYAGQDDEVYVSYDRGKNWEPAGKVGASTIRDIVVMPDSLYVLASNSGIYKSIDDGKSWSKLDSGIESTFQYRDLFHDLSNGQIYLTTDNGLYNLDNSKWREIGDFDNSNAPIKIAALGNIIYASSEDGKIYKSEDSGTSWKVIYEAEDIGSHQGFNFPLAVHPDFPDIIYIATDEQILKTINGGESWENIGKDVKDDSLFTMAYARDTNTLWVGEYWTRGLFTTSDEGETWKFIESWRSTEPHDHYPMNIVVGHSNGKNVYVSGAYGVKQTKDKGDTWQAIGEDVGINKKHVHGLQINPENPSVLYAGSAPGWGQESPISEVFKSIDGGESWKRLNNFPEKPENNVYAFSVVNDVIYASLNQHESEHNEEHNDALGVWKSEDGGDTWEDVSSNLPNRNVFPVTANLKNPDVVYAGLGHIEQFSDKGEQGLFRSSDGGEKWERVKELPEIQPSKIRFHPTNSDVVFVSFGEHVCGACSDGIDERDEEKYPRGAGLWGSIDGGNTWHQLTTEIFSNRQMAVMDFVFKDESVVYVGTDDGIFKGEISFANNEK